MGKSVQIKSQYSSVLLPSGLHNGGATVSLTDAEYAALDPNTLRVLTMLGDVADPQRPKAPGTGSTGVVDHHDGYISIDV